MESAVIHCLNGTVTEKREVSQRYSESTSLSIKTIPTGHTEKLLLQESSAALGPGSDRSGGLHPPKFSKFAYTNTYTQHPDGCVLLGAAG